MVPSTNSNRLVSSRLCPMKEGVSPIDLPLAGAADLREHLERSQVVSEVGLGRLAGAAG